MQALLMQNRCCVKWFFLKTAATHMYTSFELKWFCATLFHYGRLTHRCYGWKWPFLAKNHHTKYSAKSYDILIKWKVFESLWSGFVISVKKICFLFWAWSIVTSFLCKLGPKMVIFRCFTKIFLKLLDCN